MEIIEFKGYRCTRRPAAEWGNYTCNHLSKYISKPGSSEPTSIVSILLDGSKTSEIFLIIKGPLPVVNENAESPIRGNGSVITCDSCWITVYDERNA